MFSAVVAHHHLPPTTPFLLSFQVYIAAMDFSQMSSAEQAHMTRVIERKQVRLQARHNILEARR